MAKPSTVALATVYAPAIHQLRTPRYAATMNGKQAKTDMLIRGSGAQA
ncbi:hypothetical protein ABT224_13340 [Streptomyces sp. NPDC001584]